jgi:hypothetical protein
MFDMTHEDICEIKEEIMIPMTELIAEANREISITLDVATWNQISSALYNQYHQCRYMFPDDGDKLWQAIQELEGQL